MLHLVHPILVHFTASFLVVGGVCEAIGIFLDRPQAARLGSTLVVLGTVSLVPTIATGFLAENVLDVPTRAAAIVARHESVGLALLGVFLGTQLWKAWFRGVIPEAQRWLYAAILLGGVALVAYGAFLGGEMVYREGVGVVVR